MTFVLVPLAILRTTTDPDAPLDCVRQTYVKKLLKYGLRPLFVNSQMPEQTLLEYLKGASGAFFFGGSDISPDLYGKKPHPKTDPKEIERDQMEYFLLKKIVARKIPFLGVCRGSQMLNVALGGTLIQHIPDLKLPEEHNFEGQVYSNLTERVKHQVRIDPTSRAFGIVKKDMIVTNSGHHQAVDTLAKDLRVSGVSMNGIVEITEYQDKNYFCFGLQSHPEVEENGDLEKFFDRFAWACKN